jgi:hypothetical protein
MKLLPKSKKNFLKRGDRVQLKSGEIVVVRGLEFGCFTAEGKKNYISKKDIHTVLGT